MKKTVKRFLTAALVMAMVLTTVMVPVSVEAATKTEVLMYDDMSVQPLSNILEMSATDSNLIEYNNGNIWGSKGAYDTSVANASTGDLVIKSAPSVSFDDYVIRRQLFGNYPAKSNSDVRIVYEVKTGDFTSEWYRVIPRLRDNDGSGATKDIDLFRYDAHNGGLKDRTASENKYNLSANTDYRIVIDLKKRTSGDGFTYVFTITDAKGNASITSGGNQVSEASATESEWYPTEIPNTSHLDEINIQLRKDAGTTYTKEADLFTFKTIKVLNFVEPSTEVETEIVKKWVTLMDDTMGIQPLSNTLGMSADNADLVAYNKGNVWGSKGEYDTRVANASTGDLVVKADPSVKFDDYVIRRQLFGNYPAQADTNVKFTYDIKTGEIVTGEYFRVVARLRDNDGTGTKDFNLFTYDAHNGSLKDTTASQNKYVLSANTEYKIVIELKKRTSGTGFTYVFTISDATGNASITSGSDVVSAATASQSEWYTTEIPNTSHLDEINLHLLSSNTTYTRNADLFTFKNINVANYADVEVEIVPETVIEGYTVMDDDMAAIISKYFTQDYDLVNLDGTEGRDENSNEYKLYHNGDVWAKVWASDAGSYSVDSNGMVITAKTANTYEDGQETTVSKKPFTKLVYQKADLRLEYAIKTAEKYVNSTDSSVSETSGSVNVQSAIDDLNIFTYSPETMQVTVGEEKISVDEYRSYKMVFDFVYNDANKNYDLTCSVLDEDGVPFKTVTVQGWGMLDLDVNTNLIIRYNRGKQIVKEAKLITIESIKLDEIIDAPAVKIDDAAFNPEDVMIDCRDNADISNAVALSNEKYLNGENWGITHPEKLETSFKENGNTIACYSTHTMNELVELRKKFEPITDGEVLKAEGKFFITHTKADSANSLAWLFKIGLSGGSADLNMLTYKSSPYWNYLSVLHEGNYALWDDPASNTQAVTISGEGKGNTISTEVDTFKVGDVPNCGANSSYLDGTVAFVLTATPNASDNNKYDLVLKLTGSSIDATATKTVDKSYVMGLTDITVGMIEKKRATEEVFRVSDIKVSKYQADGKTAFVTGTNKVYLPLSNLTGKEATYSIIAAVCDKSTHAQKNFYIRQYTKHAATLDNLEIDVDITDPLSEYVKVFVFNGYDTLVPYTKSKVLGK